ncbi:hypothetical protein OH77DRAFT_344662 [Trametes cingulata]|nr:hypothetical protein OH77DRAFT_344662 [Trametes cingulata]
MRLQRVRRWSSIVNARAYSGLSVFLLHCVRHSRAWRLESLSRTSERRYVCSGTVCPLQVRLSSRRQSHQSQILHFDCPFFGFFLRAA